MPPKWGWGSFPSVSPQAGSCRCQGRRGPAPSPAPAALGHLLALSPQMCGEFGGDRGTHKGARGCPPFPAEVELPLGCVFLAPRPVARCSPALLARTGELFPLQRKPGEVTAGPSAVPPWPQDGRHGGKPGREGSPISSLSPHPPGRGCGARPWEKCSRRVPGVCASTLRSGAHTRVRDTHIHPRRVSRRCDTPTRVGTRVRRGCNTRVRARTGPHSQRSRAQPCPQTDTDPRFASVVCKRPPAGRTPAAPQLRQPWGSPTPATHSPAPSFPKFIGFVTPFPHSTQPTQLRAVAGAGLREAAAEGSPPASFPAQGERTRKR